DGVTYPDRAAAHRREARDQLEQGGLAAAARPYQGDELVLGDVERDALDRGDQVAATGPVGLLHALESDQDLAPGVSLLLRGQEIARVDLLERHLPLEAEIFRVGVPGLLEPRGLELADRDLAARDLLGVDEAAGHLRGAERAVGIHLGIVLHDVLHTLVEMLLPERIVGAAKRSPEEGLERLRVPGHRL